MISIRDCATLSLHVYHPKHRKYFGLSIEPMTQQQIKTGLKTGFAMITDVDDYTSSAKPVYVQLYVKFSEGKATDAVIAIRGTVPSKIGNDVVDIVSWFSDVFAKGGDDKIPSYDGPSHFYIKHCVDYLRHYFSEISRSHIFLTGHSLGGALAQLTTLRGDVYYTCAFNAPGVGHMPHVSEEYFAWVLNINSKYGFINKIGKTLGALELIDVPEDELQAKILMKNFIEKDYQAGKLNAMLAAHSPNKLTEIMLDKTAGIDEMLAVLSSETGLSHSQLMQDQYLRCQHHLDKSHWLILKNLLAPTLCKAFHELEVPAQTIQAIAAQHSMKNMLTTLLETKYREIAYSRACYESWPVAAL